MSVWDDPELAVGGEFIEFNNVGDVASGVIKVVRTHRFDDGKVVPQLLLVCDDGEERTLTAGQIRLKMTLVEQRPEAGDHIRVTYTSKEPRAGGKTLKHFDVQITRNHAPHLAQTAAPVTAPAPAAAPPTQSYTPPPAPAPAPATPQAAPPTPSPAGGVVDPAAAAAAIAALSAEQRAALGL